MSCFIHEHSDFILQRRKRVLIGYCMNCQSKEDGALTVVCVLGEGGKGEGERMKWREAGRELDIVCA